MPSVVAADVVLGIPPRGVCPGHYCSASALVRICLAKPEEPPVLWAVPPSGLCSQKVIPRRDDIGRRPEQPTAVVVLSTCLREVRLDSTCRAGSLHPAHGTDWYRRVRSATCEGPRNAIPLSCGQSSEERASHGALTCVVSYTTRLLFRHSEGVAFSSRKHMSVGTTVVRLA